MNRALYQARLLSADLVPRFGASAAASHNIDNGNAARTRPNSGELRGRPVAEAPQRRQRRNGNTRPRWKTGKPHGWPSSTTVADTYFELKYLDESIKVMDASVKRYQELLRLIEAKYEFGKGGFREPPAGTAILLSACNSLLDLQDRQNVARQTLGICSSAR